MIPKGISDQHQHGLTKRALDAGDSAAFSSIFLASSFSYSQTESTPTPAPVTQTVRQPWQAPLGEAGVHRSPFSFCLSLRYNRDAMVAWRRR